MIKLNKIITIIGGGTPSKLISHYWNGSIPWASVKDLRSDYIEKTIDSISLEAVSNSATQIIPKGSIIIGTRMAVGKVSINLVDLAINQDLKAIICSDKVFYKYLFYFFKSKEECLNSLASGATVKGIKLEHIKNLEIPLPPLATQKHIADILDAADALRRKTQQIVDSYDELAQSLFLEMFGDPFKNSKNWELIEFEKLGSLDRGKSKHRPRNAPELLGGSHPLIQTGDIANAPLYIKNYKSTYSDIGLAQSKKWPKGTLCITIAANIAKCSILSFEACFPDSVVGFIPNDKTVNEYIYFLLSILQGSIEELAPAAAQKNINLKFLRELQIPTPPIDLQNQFAKKIALIEQQKELARQSLAESENLFNALLQKAFKGELVPEPQPAEQAV
ncbi:restriction endonuclease subunit S [Alistipes sp. ZOR0009]|uniref:restriction endonuclease subunit S n=1 Tax=Alistipes sp. ZOR0009 TaxID=1339253 RepID=UPI00068E3CE4|nr:restriction endonuclease subunit S [Alistipes sp. ZOR0009]